MFLIYLPPLCISSSLRFAFACRFSRYVPAVTHVSLLFHLVPPVLIPVPDCNCGLSFISTSSLALFLPPFLFQAVSPLSFSDGLYDPGCAFLPSNFTPISSQSPLGALQPSVPQPLDPHSPPSVSLHHPSLPVRTICRHPCPSKPPGETQTRLTRRREDPPQVHGRFGLLGLFIAHDESGDAGRKQLYIGFVPESAAWQSLRGGPEAAEELRCAVIPRGREYASSSGAELLS
ncbi:hypothetical protein BDV98DRAFT_574016, partial [Pterulicium gracile]